MVHAPTQSAPAPAQTAGAPDFVSDIAEPIIEAHGLVKRYGSMTAVDGVDLTVATGEVFGILGPNGAGKTTTLEMIEGLRKPDAGTIRVAGFDAVRQNEAVRRVIGVQLQTTALFDYLSASELIELFGGLYGTPPSRDEVGVLLAMVGLEEKRASRVNQMSGGQQQRLSIALALVNRPQVVFLDEPTTGLDPQARRTLWQTVRDIRAAGTTVVLTTHYMEEAETLCDRVAIMDRGRVIACDTPSSLVRSLNMAAVVRAQVTHGAFQDDELAALPGVTETEVTAESPDGVFIRLHTTEVQSTLVALLELAGQNRITLADLSSTQANLEDVFLSLTGRAYEGGEAAGRRGGKE